MNINFHCVQVVGLGNLFFGCTIRIVRGTSEKLLNWLVGSRALKYFSAFQHDTRFLKSTKPPYLTILCFCLDPVKTSELLSPVSYCSNRTIGTLGHLGQMHLSSNLEDV